jgi:hypothetical protein
MLPKSDLEFANICISVLVVARGVDVEGESEFLRMIDWIRDIVDLLPLVDELVGVGIFEVTLA